MSDQLVEGGQLALGPQSRRSVGWWGVVCLIATEASLFAMLLFSYYYTASQNAPEWLLGENPSLRLSLPDTILLLASSVVLWWADRRVKRGENVIAALASGLTFVMGAGFVIVQLFEWKSKTYSIAENSYSSLYFTITGFHMAHVVAGLIGLACLTVWLARKSVTTAQTTPMLLVSSYWHFVDAVWVAVFFTFYIWPRLW